MRPPQSLAVSSVPRPDSVMSLTLRVARDQMNALQLWTTRELATKFSWTGTDRSYTGSGEGSGWGGPDSATSMLFDRRSKDGRLVNEAQGDAEGSSSASSDSGWVAGDRRHERNSSR